MKPVRHDWVRLPSDRPLPIGASGGTIEATTGERHQIAIPGRHAKDAENRRIPFDPQGRMAPVLKRRASLGPNAYVFGSPAGAFVANFKTAWESLLLIANGYETKRAKPGARVDRAKLRQIDLHWHGPAT